MGTLILVIIALVSISILVLVHEFGHFIAAKKLGVWPEEFGIGLPPRIWGKKYGETIYSVNALPIGGFVRLHGETNEEKVSKPKRAFLNQPKWKRVAIAVAGVFMNFVFAWAVFSLVYSFTGIPQNVIVAEISPDSPADAAGLMEGDVITHIGEKRIVESNEFPNMIADKKGEEFVIQWEREVEGKIKTESSVVYLRSEAPVGEGLLGVSWGYGEVYKPSILLRPFVSAYYGARKTVFVSNEIIKGFADLFAQLFVGQAPKGLAGPVGVTGIIAEVAKFGLLPLMEFLAIISVNLALINLVPFPPLDGSRVMFIAIEAVLGKKILPKIESAIHTAGMAVLLFLMLLLTVNEIPKLLSAGSLSNFVNLLIQ